MAARAVVGAATSVLLLVALSLVGCAPEPGSARPSSSPSASATPTSTPSPTATPSPAATGLVGAALVPEDCTAPLTAAVREQLADIPLNDPADGTAVGPQPDGSLICLWRDPAADTTFLETRYVPTNRGPALDLLNGLAADEGFSCYTPDDGTRCERTWENEQYPGVIDGRTLFWRDDLLIDTAYSNLAPSGYTSAIVAALWP